MIKVGIVGATGYTGLELIRLLLNHPQVEISILTSESYQGQKISEVFPSLSGKIDHTLVALDSKAVQEVDVLFLALPHTVAMAKVPQFLKSGLRVIDLSADYRLKSSDVFEAWYGVAHEHPELLHEAVYGLPEIHREEIRSAQLVANPGCYPTSVILALLPLLGTDWVDLDSIIADCKSGVSGAGRKTSLTTHFSECNAGVSAYNLATHRHTPEIEQALSRRAGKEIRVTFSPHLIPMTRGMLSTIYMSLKKEMTCEDLVAHFRQFYKDEPFVRILKAGTYANTHYVSHSNFCDIGLQVDQRNGRVILTSAIDNLMKGASGQAVQNMNIMLGMDEKTALDSPGIFP
jgi:N-acetyl-gamma-glutamyl-phosphate reductase